MDDRQPNGWPRPVSPALNAKLKAYADSIRRPEDEAYRAAIFGAKVSAAKPTPSWDDLRQAMAEAVVLIDAKAPLGEIKQALLQPYE